MNEIKKNIFRIVGVLLFIVVLIIGAIHDYNVTSMEAEEYKIKKDILCYEMGYSFSSGTDIFNNFECINSIDNYTSISKQEFNRFYISRNKTELINKYK